MAIPSEQYVDITSNEIGGTTGGAGAADAPGVSVLWGNIIGDIQNQADLIALLNTFAPEIQWGTILGDITDQADLIALLDEKVDLSALGSAAFQEVSAFATAAQGIKADSAAQFSTPQQNNPNIIAPAGVDASGVIYGADGLPVPSAPGFTYVQAVTAVTSATPAAGAFTPLDTVTCSMVEIRNTSGLGVEYQISGAGNTIPIPNGAIRRIYGISNANQVAFRLINYADGPTLGTAQTRTARVQGIAYSGGGVFTRAGILNLTISNGGSFTAFGSQACTYADVINTTGKNIRVRTNSTSAYFLLKNNDSVMISGITNASQVQVQPDDGVANMGDVKLEAFTASDLKSTFSSWFKAQIIDPSSRIYPDEQSYPTNNQPASFLPIGGLRNLGKRAAPKGRKILTSFKTVATCNGSVSGLTDVSDNLERLYGQTTVEFTQAASGTYRFRGDVALSTGVDVTNTSIRMRVAIPYNSGINYSTIASSFTSLKIRIFSSGSPASPASDYHELTISRTSFTAYYNPATDLSRIVEIGADISRFTVVGAGATLTAITYAEVAIDTAITGANGSKLRLFDVSSVPRQKSKATVMFSGDDLYVSQWNVFAPLARQYAYPWMINADTLIKLGQSGFMTAQNLQQLTQYDGCELTYQNFRSETNVNMAPDQWLNEASKFTTTAKALGYGDVLNGSYGSAANTNINAERLEASRRMFRTLHLANSGNNQNPPMTFGELQPLTDPYRVKRLLMNGFTGGTVLQRWKDHIDQAVTCNGVAFFGFHDEFSGGEAATEIPNLIAYIRTLELAGSVEVMTINQFIDQVY